MKITENSKEHNVGKAYANRKTKEDRPVGDFYETPKSLVWCAEDLINKEFSKDNQILEPCCGNGAVSEELVKMGFSVSTNDLYRGGYDYLTSSFKEEFVITNPPFSQFDDFVLKSKSHCKKFMYLGRLNYFGTQSRLDTGLWNNLKSVHCFSRYVDYRTESRSDGLFNVGAMATAWFIWDMEYEGDTKIDFLDVKDYAKLGNIK